jgi:transcriptional regulator with XRE-family HTH domain
VLDSHSIILDDSSSMQDDPPSNLTERMARRVRDLRAEHGLSLDELAARSGVSRSMISLIERAESSPTAVVLEKLATGLGVSLASLFELPGAAAHPVARLADQPSWRDPGSGYVRRNVSPSGFASPLQIVEVAFPAGARVSFDTGARLPRVHQQVWVQEGTIEVTLGDVHYRLAAGDCLAMVLDQPITYHNPTRKPARYAVVITSEPSSWR